MSASRLIDTNLTLPPSSSLSDPKCLLKVSPQGQEERQGPKDSVDLSQLVCYGDTGSIYSIVMMSWFTLRFCSIMASWCREGSRCDVRSRLGREYMYKFVKHRVHNYPKLITAHPFRVLKMIVMVPAVIWPTFAATCRKRGNDDLACD